MRTAPGEAMLDGAPGDALSRRFRVERVMGTGGMGVVVAAHHLALDRRVAIKLMRPELRTRADLVRRFVREARAAARLTSPHAVRVFDISALDDGAPYIVMEHLDGVDLAVWLRQRGPAPVAVASELVLQACDAIAEAHAAGIVHRDLKPANLFVTRDRDGRPQIKVLDLGICKLIERDGQPDTSSLGPLGTPAYMAPEQLSAARRADARADIWSLGAILHELVTGRAPFAGAARVGPVPAMQRVGVPAQFEAVVARCLAHDPAARFQRIAELVAALAPFAERGSGEAALARVAGRARRARRWWTAGAVVVALGASGMVPWIREAPVARSGAGSASPIAPLRSLERSAPAAPPVLAAPEPVVVPAPRQADGPVLVGSPAAATAPAASAERAKPVAPRPDGSIRAQHRTTSTAAAPKRAAPVPVEPPSTTGAPPLSPPTGAPPTTTSVPVDDRPPAFAVRDPLATPD